MYQHTDHEPSVQSFSRRCEADHGGSLQRVSAQLSLHLRRCLTALFITVSSAVAETLEMLLDTCEALSIFVAQQHARSGVPEATQMQSLLSSALAAFAQQVRSEPDAEVLTFDLQELKK